MALPMDASIGLAAESTYKTYVAPSRFYEMVDESLQWNKQINQGQGLRVGSRVARAARRVVAAADGGGDISVEAVSKGMGVLWQACLGAGTSTLVSGSTYQQNFTLADAPTSLTIQKGLVEAGGTVDAYSFLGCMVGGWEFDFPNNDIASLKVTIDAGDLTTAQTYATPSYPASPVNLYSFAGASISTGTFTAASSTTLPSAATATVDVRGGTTSVNNNLTSDRYNAGGAGRKSKPTVGIRAITGTLNIEYDSTAYRDLVLNDGSLTLVVTLTAGALSTGLETLTVALPAIRFENQLPQANGSDLIVQAMNFTALDDGTNPPIGVYMRTADSTI